MIGAPRIEGYAVISEDGMIADAHGRFPDALKREEDQRFYKEALDRVDVVVNGRHSGEQHPNSSTRRRLIVTRQVRALTFDPLGRNVILWNPQSVPFEDALKAFATPPRSIGILGGTDVFEIFLDHFDVFYLTRIAGVLLPAGRPVFRGVPERAPEDILSAHGLKRGEDVLRVEGLTIAAWTRA